MARRSAAVAPAVMAGPTTRTTLVLPLTLDQNLEVYALHTGMAKGEVIKMVLTEYLRNKGLQPDKRPKVTIDY